MICKERNHEWSSIPNSKGEIECLFCEAKKKC